MVADQLPLELNSSKPPSEFGELAIPINLILSKHRTYTPFRPPRQELFRLHLKNYFPIMREGHYGFIRAESQLFRYNTVPNRKGHDRLCENVTTQLERNVEAPRD